MLAIEKDEREAIDKKKKGRSSKVMSPAPHCNQLHAIVGKSLEDALKEDVNGLEGDALYLEGVRERALKDFAQPGAEEELAKRFEWHKNITLKHYSAYFYLDSGGVIRPKLKKLAGAFPPYLDAAFDVLLCISNLQELSGLGPEIDKCIANKRDKYSMTAVLEKSGSKPSKMGDGKARRENCRYMGLYFWKFFMNEYPGAVFLQLVMYRLATHSTSKDVNKRVKAAKGHKSWSKDELVGYPVIAYQHAYSRQRVHHAESSLMRGAGLAREEELDEDQVVLNAFRSFDVRPIDLDGFEPLVANCVVRALLHRVQEYCEAEGVRLPGIGSIAEAYKFKNILLKPYDKLFPVLEGLMTLETVAGWANGQSRVGLGMEMGFPYEDVTISGMSPADRKEARKDRAPVSSLGEGSKYLAQVKRAKESQKQRRAAGVGPNVDNLVKKQQATKKAEEFGKRFALGSKKRKKEEEDSE